MKRETGKQLQVFIKDIKKLIVHRQKNYLIKTIADSIWKSHILIPKKTNAETILFFIDQSSQDERKIIW